MSSTTNELIQVTCAIIVDNGRILAALRSRQMSQSWKWEFPGGKIDKGETAEECVIREIKEELNILITVNESLTPTIHSYPDKTIKLIPFICSITEGTVTAVEHEKVSWFSPEELKSLNWADADLPVMEEFVRLQVVKV
ncbi:(deoxy)nucleoside triphosphate pyrophosphohydrolase [Carboxylicivirga mesophila]|uniref:8-oxo-dGTP diphosphatase n=1 Tax=Carboxylicivirga mesophila TaxID=1166478 RepID=A0ABS5KFM3_9BACT|nr:(deoxy)nucleoside triphosphate pyrophosphohydrolase [Carboxylicivirga mesophila]MBS2213709.1 (deoxy)nucleoside triphosphate pyrophosphohydrolase [Carboxylicivirga mesophila]